MSVQPKNAAVAATVSVGAVTGLLYAKVSGTRAMVPIVIGAAIGFVFGASAYVVMTGMGIE